VARNLLIEHPVEGLRAVIDPVALRQHEDRGWVGVGLCSEPSRDPLLTDAEQAAADTAERERIAALLAPESGEAPAPSRPRK
jgi:hypothetical protein